MHARSTLLPHSASVMFGLFEFWRTADSLSANDSMSSEGEMGVPGGDKGDGWCQEVTKRGLMELVHETPPISCHALDIIDCNIERITACSDFTD